MEALVHAVYVLYLFSYRLDVFASADAAYVLAYSIIMLTTDLHSSQVYIAGGVCCINMLN